MRRESTFPVAMFTAHWRRPIPKWPAVSEFLRQRDEIELIASRTSSARRCWKPRSGPRNKYAEGLLGRRYYGGASIPSVGGKSGN